MNPTVDSASSRVPARRPGNFHLLAQMKVTKAKGLNTHLCGEDGGFTDALFEAPRGSARLLVDPSSLCDFIGRKSALGVVDVRLIGAADSFGLERARSKAIAAACNESSR